MLKVTCKGCGANYKAPDDFAGRKIRCKACSEVMLVGADEAPPSPPPVEAEVPQEAAPAEAEASQEAAPAEKKAPGKKKISFKKGAIKARKGDKKYSFKKDGGSKKAADPEAGDRKAYSGSKKSGSKKSPAVLVLALLLVVGGLAALDYFVLHMVIGSDPHDSHPVAVEKDTPQGDAAEEPGTPVEPEEPAEKEEPEVAAEEPAEEPVDEPAEEPAEEAPAATAEIPAASVPLASIVPAEATLLLNVDVARLIGAVEGLTGEKIPRTPEELAAGSDQLPQPIKAALAAGLDPFSFQRVLVAYSLPTPEATEEKYKEYIEKMKSLPGRGGGIGLPVELDPIQVEEDRKYALSLEGRMYWGSMMAVIEGEFSDPAAMIAAMIEGKILCGPEHKDPDRRPQVRDGLNVYSFLAGPGPGEDSWERVYFTFLSRGQMLIARSSSMLDKVIALRKGEGKAISSNEVFNSMSKSLGRTEALWVVASVPKEAEALLGQGLPGPPGGLPGADDEAGAPAPAIKIDSLMLALDSSGTDFSLEFVGATPSPEDAENTQKTIGTQLGGLSLIAMQMLGPKALGLMGKLTPKAEDKNVIISFKLTEQEIVTVREMVEKAFSGFAGPGPDDKGFELPEGLDPSDFEEAPEPAEPAAPGDEAEAVDPGQEPEEPAAPGDEAEAVDPGQEPEEAGSVGEGAEAVDPDPGPGSSVTILIAGATGAELRKKLSSAGEPGEPVFFKLNDLVLAAAQKADSGIDEISGSLDDDVASFEVGPVEDLAAFVEKFSFGKVGKVDPANRTIEIDLLGGGEKATEEPEAPTDPEPPADPAESEEPEEKDGGGEDDPLDLDDL